MVNMCSSGKRAAIMLCLAFNLVGFNAGAKNTWTGLSSDQSQKPIVDAEYPHFGPYRDNQSFQVSDQIAVAAEGAEEPLLPSKQEQTKPLNNFVAGLYHNYRSSYVGNKTTIRIPNRNRIPSIEEVDNKIDELDATDELNLSKRKRKPLTDFENEIKYNVGPGVNISVEMDKELVSVYLDEDCLKDVFTGRGRKHDLITKILPLFILPFLIQSAVVPFLLSALKLLLIKSIVVGKIAILLLLVSAFRNHVKYGYEGAQSFYSDPPSRRSEALNGYRVEGKPTTWVN